MLQQLRIPPQVSALGSRISPKQTLQTTGTNLTPKYGLDFPLAFLVINTGQTTKGDRHVRGKACGA